MNITLPHGYQIRPVTMEDLQPTVQYAQRMVNENAGCESI